MQTEAGGMLTGGCFCGQVRYQVNGPAFNATICHCVDCRRVAGAPVVAWFTVRPEEFRVVAGTPTVFRSSAAVARSFCPACGTPLTYRNDAFPTQVDVTTASLDDPEQVVPQDHVFVARALSWMPAGDGLPRYATTRSAK